MLKRSTSASVVTSNGCQQYQHKLLKCIKFQRVVYSKAWFTRAMQMQMQTQGFSFGCVCTCIFNVWTGWKANASSLHSHLYPSCERSLSNKIIIIVRISKQIYIEQLEKIELSYVIQCFGKCKIEHSEMLIIPKPQDKFKEYFPLPTRANYYMTVCVIKSK